MFEATLPCLRCSVLRTIEISEDVQTDEVTLDVEGGGLVTCICRDCLTGAEALAIARKSAVTLLNVTEDLIARIEYVWERVPGTKDDPKTKEAHAEALQQAQEARVALQALMEVADDAADD